MTQLALDSAIRDNALIPIFFVIVGLAFIRTKLLMVLKDKPKVKIQDLKSNNVISRAKRLVQGMAILGVEAYNTRYSYFIAKDTGALDKFKPKSKDPMEQMSAMQDPSQAMGMMKNQMVFIFSQGTFLFLFKICCYAFRANFDMDAMDLSNINLKAGPSLEKAAFARGEPAHRCRQLPLGLK